MKSGAEVKKRPVVKTELWPHTIANEEDGEDVSCENITLSKFLACYTYIMVNCTEAAEVDGRSVFLHAISTVMEYLPWAEACAFHNIIMVKIEQDRVKWSENFLTLADNFLDKKVRLSLRLKSYSGSVNSSHSNFGRSYDQDWDTHNLRYKNNFNSSRSNFIYYAMCYQWNYGECSYGSECKRWHACRFCAAEGKCGESHKASSHDSSSAMNKQCNQSI